MARVAVLGSPSLIDACAPSPLPGSLDVVELREGVTADALRSAGPDAVVAFEPGAELVDLLAELGLPAILWTAAPGAAPGGPAQRLVLAAGDGPAAWRCVSLPVADSLYAPVADLPARAAWLGPGSARRVSYLSWFQHAEPPADDGEDAVVAVNLHDDSPAFDPRVTRALAAGRLLVSETLVPSRGLEPGIDYLEARDLDDLYLAVESAVQDPHAFRRVRLRGRRKAELFRASRVIGRLVGDLQLELDGVHRG